MSPAAPEAPRCRTPSETMPQPMPVPTLTYSRCAAGLAVRVLAERHRVDVVVDQDGSGVAALEEGRDAAAVPAGHDRRADHGAAGELHRARDADADGPQVVGRAPGGGEQLLQVGAHAGQDGLGAGVDVDGAVRARPAPGRTRWRPRAGCGWRPDRSRATTIRASDRSRASGGRPRSVAAGSVSTSSPRSMSRSTRWAMAARDSPVAPTIAERVVAAPSATSPASSLSDAMRRLAALFIRPLPSASGEPGARTLLYDRT